MRKLVLVDLDNVLGFFEDLTLRKGLWLPRFDRKLSRWGWVPDDGAEVGSEPYPRRDACVVTIAANTATVRRHGFDLPDLWRFARHIARMFGPIEHDAVRMEVALTLPSPQAVDRALRQLMLRAPNEGGAGRFELLALLSHDRGLREAVACRLPKGRCGYPIREAYGLVEAFSLPEKLCEGHSRRYAETPSDAEGAMPALPEEGYNVLRIATPGACAWASRQGVQRGATLVETARLVEANPARLTQIALTRSSFRGPSRLLASVGATVGACASSDGLEFARELSETRRLPAGVMRVSSLGAGAVAVDPPGVTVGTALPMAWVLRRETHTDVIVGPAVARLDDQGLLMATDPLCPSGWMCRVALRARAHSSVCAAALLADVLPDQSAELTGWWYGHDRRSRSRCEVEGAQGLLRHGQSLETLAQHAVLVVGRHRELILMAPRVGEVTVAQHVARGTLGACTSGGLPFVLLALDGPLPAGTRLDVLPLQDVNVDVLERRGQGMGLTSQIWEVLRRMPILIPTETESGLAICQKEVLPCVSLPKP
jgi:hypothetical protein